MVPPWCPLFVSHQYHYAGTWTGHVTSICHIVWFDQLPIRVCTIGLLLLNFCNFPKTRSEYPQLITHQYQYAGTWTWHVGSIWHTVWFYQFPIRVCTNNAMHLVKFAKIARMTPSEQPWQPHRYDWAPWKRAKYVLPDNVEHMWGYRFMDVARSTEY